LIFTLVVQNAITDLQEFAHGSADRLHVGFARVQEALFLRHNVWVMVASDNGGHIELSA
jgi:hypothetical protein